MDFLTTKSGTGLTREETPAVAALKPGYESEAALLFRRRRHEVSKDAQLLMERFGRAAYDEARTRAREARLGGVIDANRPAGHWDRVRAEIARRTRRAHVDTATRYLSRRMG
jgi:hypothetical protein